MKTQHARIVSYIALAAGAVGFALPILGLTSALSTPVVQEVDEWRGHVARFSRIEGDLSKAVPLSTSQMVGVGDPQVYVFVEPGGEVLCGSIEALEPDLRSITDRGGLLPSTRMQILELIGAPEEQRIARAAVQEDISAKLGPRSAKFYRNAALRSELWRLLLSRAPDGAAAERVLAVRARLGAWINDLGSVSLDLREMDARDLEWARGAELCHDLALAFSLQPTDAAYKEPMNASDAFSTRTFLEKVHEIGRQEERIAVLLSTLMAQPNDAPHLLQDYQVRTAFEQRALSTISRYLGPNVDRQLTWQPRVRLAAFKICEDVFPKNRGRYLYHLADYLRSDEDVANFIRRKVRASNSMFVEQFAEEILEIVDDKDE